MNLLLLCFVCNRERANLGISLLNSESGEILAHASLLDYPSVASVDPAHWEQWTRENFTDEIRASVSLHNHHLSLSHTYIHTQLYFQPMNSLFLHLFVAKDSFHQAAITETLR